MIYDAREIAKYIIDYEDAHGRIISRLRMERILYFIQALFLSRKNEPCFSNKMLAWYAGPIIEDVHIKYRFYTEGPICILDKNYFIADSDKKLIAAMLEGCREYTNTELLKKIKKQEPWQNAFNNPFNEEITVEAMRKFFVEK